MSCRNCGNFDPEEYYCKVQSGVYQVDSAESEGCPYWEPVSEQEENRRVETYGSGCLIMILLLPFLLLMKVI